MVSGWQSGGDGGSGEGRWDGPGKTKGVRKSRKEWGREGDFDT